MNIKLDSIKLKPYQELIIDAIENKGYRKVVAIMPRRSGKDVAAFWLCVRQALKKTCNIFYIAPSYTMAKRIIWNSILSDGRRFLDLIPPQVISSMNSQELLIRFINGSTIQLIGALNYNNLVGSNAYAVVFTEYSIFQDGGKCYQLIKPILAYNGGWCLFVSTPRGKANHLYDLWQVARDHKDWFALKLTLDETKHINLEEINKELSEGLTTPDLIQQEYYCSFAGVDSGSYWSAQLDKARVEDRVQRFEYDPTFKVNTAWDIGYSDSTSILFYQVINNKIYIIDEYSSEREALTHYVKIVQHRPYLYGYHIAPHDIKVHEFSSGITRLETARQLGLNFTIADDIALMDGIDCVRNTFNRIFIDERCKTLLRAIENYRPEYDAKRQMYKDRPLHDVHSHMADALRYLCVSLPKTRDDHTTAEELDKRYRQAVYGDDSMHTGFFSNNKF